MLRTLTRFAADLSWSLGVWSARGVIGLDRGVLQAIRGGWESQNVLGVGSCLTGSSGWTCLNSSHEIMK